MKRVLVIICLILLLSGNALAAEGNGVTVNVLSKTGASWDGKDLPDYTNAKPEITILRIKIPPGAVLPMHKHSVINAGVLINGELTVTTEDGHVLHLKEGQAIVEVVNTWHSGKNEGNKLAEIIVFYAGKADTLITVNK